jgi:thioredoxin reductase (NADPH)
MVHRRDRFRAQKSLAGRVLANPKIEVRFNAELVSIAGDTQVRSATVRDNRTGAERQEEAAAVFVFIGSDPQTKVVDGLAAHRDEGGYILTDQRMMSSVPGLFAAGDVRASPFRQLVVAAAEGAIAAHAAGQYIDEIRGEVYK